MEVAVYGAVQKSQFRYEWVSRGTRGAFQLLDMLIRLCQQPPRKRPMRKQ